MFGLLLTCRDEDSSHLAFSAASRTRCSAMLSLVRSTPDCNETTHKPRQTSTNRLHITPPCTAEPRVSDSSLRLNHCSLVINVLLKDDKSSVFTFYNKIIKASNQLLYY